MKYLVLARENVTNHMKGRELRNKKTVSVCEVLLDNVVSSEGELDANEAR